MWYMTTSFRTFRFNILYSYFFHLPISTDKRYFPPTLDKVLQVKDRLLKEAALRRHCWNIAVYLVYYLCVLLMAYRTREPLAYENTVSLSNMLVEGHYGGDIGLMDVSIGSATYTRT